MDDFYAFNRAMRLTVMVFVWVMAVMLFARLGEAQSPYSMPVMDYCEPVGNPYGLPVIVPGCDVDAPGVLTFDFGTGIIGRVGEMDAPVAWAAQ